MLVLRVIVPKVLPLPFIPVDSAVVLSREPDSVSTPAWDTVTERQHAALGAARLVDERGCLRPAGVVERGFVERIDDAPECTPMAHGVHASIDVCVPRSSLPACSHATRGGFQPFQRLLAAVPMPLRRAVHAPTGCHRRASATSRGAPSFRATSLRLRYAKRRRCRPLRHHPIERWLGELSVALNDRHGRSTLPLRFSSLPPFLLWALCGRERTRTKPAFVEGIPHLGDDRESRLPYSAFPKRDQRGDQAVHDREYGLDARFDLPSWGERWHAGRLRRYK